MKKIFLVALLAIVGIFGASQLVNATCAQMFVWPVSHDYAVGKTFNVSLRINPQANKVCAVEGTLDFGGLSCQSISVSGGLVPQTVPTCQKPYFLIGIPNCSTAVQDILTVSVKGAKIGKTNFSIKGVDVIGTGTDVDFTSQGGVYNIVAAKTPTTPGPVEKIETPVQTPNNQTKPEQVFTITMSVVKTIIIVTIIFLFILAIISGGMLYAFKKKKKSV